MDTRKDDKEILRQQLQLLAEISKQHPSDIANIARAMCEIYTLLHLVD